MNYLEHIEQGTTEENVEIEITDLDPPDNTGSSRSSWFASALLGWQRSPNKRHFKRYWRLACTPGILLLLVILYSLSRGFSLPIVSDFMKRGSLEVTFEEGRAHLGIETQRQWSDRAFERSTPLLFGLSSLVTLFGQALHPDGCIPITQAAWYRKHTATSRDVLALVRRPSVGPLDFSHITHRSGRGFSAPLYA